MLACSLSLRGRVYVAGNRCAVVLVRPLSAVNSMNMLAKSCVDARELLQLFHGKRVACAAVVC